MPQEIESTPYLEASRAAYLERSSAYAGRELSNVEAAVAHLHRELLDAASIAPSCSRRATGRAAGSSSARRKSARGYEERQSVAKQRKRWRRYAKLTPCLVSTLHMVPRFFTAWEGREAPLYDFVDLLIVEEAGQVSPEVAAPVFAPASRR